VGLGVLLVVATACDPGALAPMAFTRPADDPTGVEIVMGQCRRGEAGLATDQVTSVRLSTSTGFLVDEEDRVLWSISTARPRTLGEVRVGDVPAGWVEDVALAEPLPDIALVVVTSPPDGAETGEVSRAFALEDLPDDTDSVLFGREVMSRTEFLEYVRRERCSIPITATDVVLFIGLVFAASVASCVLVLWGLASIRRLRDRLRGVKGGNPT